MKQKRGIFIGFLVLFGILFICGLSFASPPTLLVVVRASDDTLWKMTCDEMACSPFSYFPGKFRFQPTVAWDETAQVWVLVGTAGDNSVWMSTFNKLGNFNNDWIQLPGMTPSPAGVAGGTPRGMTRTVNCATQSLQTEINAANPGDVINVTGTCNENVGIPPEKQRITLDGGGVATLNGGSSSSTLTVRGGGITIQNFTITGGSRGVLIYRGGSAALYNNIIQNTGGTGVTVSQSSFGVIRNNLIQNNLYNGILVEESSNAHIGCDTSSDTSPSPNTIQNNGTRGILVWKASHALIVNNTISNNTSDGIAVFRLSQVNTGSNTINSNGGNGIYVGHNSGVELGEDSPTDFYGFPNYTTVNNTGYGIQCVMGAYVKGHLGSSNQINGALGQQNLASNCPNSISTP